MKTRIYPSPIAQVTVRQRRSRAHRRFGKWLVGEESPAFEAALGLLCERPFVYADDTLVEQLVGFFQQPEPVR